MLAMTDTWFHDSLGVESHLTAGVAVGRAVELGIFRQCWCRNVPSATDKVVAELGSVIPKVSFWLCV